MGTLTRNLSNPSQATVPFLYPLNKYENQGFSDVFKGFTMGTVVRNGLITVFA